MILRAHARDIRVYGATLLPFGGHDGYDDPGGHRERARQTVNDWIRTSGQFDAVLDFDRTIRDPEAPRQLLPTVHDGDHLHLCPSGYQLLARSVPLVLFRPSVSPLAAAGAVAGASRGSADGYGR